MAYHNSDDLGAIGEDEFKLLCSSEFLHANSSNRDRTGWDFRVEQPNSKLSQTELLDRRKMPEPVMVQVKAVQASSSNVKLKLRTFERLAKLTEPAFIIIPVIGDNGKALSFWGIHIVGKALEKTLRRLAEIHSEKGGEISKNEFVSFAKNKWWDLIPIDTEQPLAKYFNEKIAEYRGQITYAAKKEQDLLNTGYDGNLRYSMSVQFEVDSEEQLYRSFLGLEPLKVSKLENFDLRFGFKRPTDGPIVGSGEMRIGATNEETGFLRIEHSQSDMFRDIPVSWRMPPTSINDTEGFRLLLSIHLLRIYIQPNQKADLWMEPTKDIKLKASAWVDTFDAYSKIANGNVLLYLLSPNYEEIGNIGGINETGVPEKMLAEISSMCSKAKIAQRVMNQIGLTEEGIDIDDVIDNCRAFESIDTLVTTGAITFSVNPNLDQQKRFDELLEKQCSIVVPGLLQVGSKHVAYAYFGLANIEPKGGDLLIRCNSDSDVAFQIVSSKTACEKFFNRITQMRKPSMRMTLEIPDFGSSDLKLEN